MALQCDKCKKAIEDVAYVEVVPYIVNQAHKEPIVYVNTEQKDLYSKRMILHDNCWVALLIQLKLTDLKRP